MRAAWRWCAFLPGIMPFWSPPPRFRRDMFSARLIVAGLPISTAPPTSAICCVAQRSFRGSSARKLTDPHCSAGLHGTAHLGSPRPRTARCRFEGWCSNGTREQVSPHPSRSAAPVGTGASETLCQSASEALPRSTTLLCFGPRAAVCLYHGPQCFPATCLRFDSQLRQGKRPAA
jgi:hypothetical protein